MSNTLHNDQLAEQIGITQDGDRIPALPAKVASSCTDRTMQIRTRVNRVNRYLKHQFQRLDKAKKQGNSEHYWVLSNLLIQKSESFQIYAFNKTLKSWWRKYDWKEILIVLRKLRRKTKYLEPTIIMDRVAILKADGVRYRPLGVPHKADRILASMIAILLSRYLPRDERQHLFVPGKGLHTAWYWILTNLKKYDNIYEYDLKGFFNSIYLEFITHILRSRYKISSWILKWLHHANHNLFQRLQAPKGYDWRSDVDLARFNQASKDGGISNYSQIFEPIIRNKRLKVIKKHLKKDLLGNPELFHDPLLLRKRGMPQGVAWSPIVSTSILPYSGVFNLPGIAGADDGIYTWNGPSIADPQKFINDGEELEGVTKHKLNPPSSEMYLRSCTSNMLRYTGIEFSDKAGSCQYLKKDGVWLTSKVTFLGSTWDLSANKLTNENHPQGFPVEGITMEQLKKVVGKNYLRPEANAFNRLKDWVTVHNESWLTHLKGWRVLIKPENFEESTWFKVRDSDGVEGYSILEDKSARSCEQLLEYLKFVGTQRTKKKAYLLPMDGWELSLHAQKYWSEKDRRGRRPGPGRPKGSKDSFPRTRRSSPEGYQKKAP